MRFSWSVYGLVTAEGRWGSAKCECGREHRNDSSTRLFDPGDTRSRVPLCPPSPQAATRPLSWGSSARRVARRGFLRLSGGGEVAGSRRILP